MIPFVADDMKIARLPRYYLERLGIKVRFRSLFFYDIALPAVNYCSFDQGMMVELIKGDALLPEHVIGWLSYDKAKRLLSETGFQLVVAYVDNEVAGTCFLESKMADLEFFDCDIPLPNDSAYITHLVVSPRRRGVGVAHVLLNYACQEAAKLGKARVTICCVPENISVQNVFSKMNWSKYAIVCYFRFIFVRFYLKKSVRSNDDGWSLIFRSGGLQII